jgi:hypothetical protein
MVSLRRSGAMAKLEQNENAKEWEPTEEELNRPLCPSLDRYCEECGGLDCEDHIARLWQRRIKEY